MLLSLTLNIFLCKIVTKYLLKWEVLFVIPVAACKSCQWHGSRCYIHQYIHTYIHTYTFVHTYNLQTFNSSTSRPDVWQCLIVHTPMDNMSTNKPNTSMAHIACESKPPSVLRSSIHSYSGNWVLIGCPVVCYARTAHTFGAGIKCLHCTLTFVLKSCG